MGDHLDGIALRTVRRREVLLSVVAFVASTTSSRLLANDKSDLLANYTALVANFNLHPDLVESSRRSREYLSAAIGLEAAPTQAAPSKTPISTRATDLLISLEISNEQLYTRRYSAPTWPGGRSGVTVAVGYDLGYAKPYAITKDWREYIDPSDAKLLAQASGIVGPQAKQRARSLRNVGISYNVAKRQFLEVMQPRYVGITERALPNFNELDLDCRGALVSLVYNRGASFDIPETRDPKSRYAEMRAIKQCMLDRTFALIPGQIRSMAHLWARQKGAEGLVWRRNLEASLFELGLQQMTGQK